MPTQGDPTPLQPILDSIVARLWDVLELAENQRHRVMFARIPESPRLQGDQDVVLRVSGARPLPGLYEGSGRLAPAVRRGLIVQARTRSGRDVSDRVDNWLETQLTFEDSILTALIGWVVVDVDLNNLLINEMRLEDTTEYKNELDRIPPTDPTWGVSTLVFSMDYVTTVSLPLVPEE